MSPIYIRLKGLEFKRKTSFENKRNRSVDTRRCAVALFFLLTKRLVGGNEDFIGVVI